MNKKATNVLDIHANIKYNHINRICYKMRRQSKGLQGLKEV